MRDHAAVEAACPAEASEEVPPAPARSAPRLAASVAAAALALAAGAGLVWAGVAWTPPHRSLQTISRGAQLYAANCVGCHGAGLEGRAAPTTPGAQTLPPPLGANGHAWQHSDAELNAIVARGIGAAALAAERPSMPAFAERLGADGIDAVLEYVKSRWPAGVSAYQAALNPNGGNALAALLRNPAWSFPNQCLPPPAVADGL